MTGVSAVKLRYTGDFALNVLSFTYQDSSTIVVTIGAADKSGRLYVYNISGSVPAPNALTVQPPNISLSSSSETANQISPITGYSITNTGSAISSYSISGSLPTGVTFSTGTGLIAGTPTQTGTFAVTITATGTTGTSSATYTLTVT